MFPIYEFAFDVELIENCKLVIENLLHMGMFDQFKAASQMMKNMNPDQLKPEERCASTSNRNFEGRQGKGGRTHLVSPEMAAAAAIAGHFVDIRQWKS